MNLTRKNKARLAFEMLEKEFEVLSKQEMTNFKYWTLCFIFLIFTDSLSYAQTIRFKESERPIMETLSLKGPENLSQKELSNLDSEVEKLIHLKNKDVNHYFIYLSYLKWRSRVGGYTKPLTMRAMNACKQWLAYKPDDMNIIYKLGLLQEWSGNLIAANKTYERINKHLNKRPLDASKKLSDDEINYFVVTAYVYLGTKQKEKSLVIINTLTKQYPDNKTIQTMQEDINNIAKSYTRKDLILRML